MVRPASGLRACIDRAASAGLVGTMSQGHRHCELVLSVRPEGGVSARSHSSLTALARSNTVSARLRAASRARPAHVGIALTLPQTWLACADNFPAVC